MTDRRWSAGLAGTRYSSRFDDEVSVDKCPKPLDGLMHCMLGKLFIFKVEPGDIDRRIRTALEEREGVAPDRAEHFGVDGSDRAAAILDGERKGHREERLPSSPAVSAADVPKPAYHRSGVAPAGPPEPLLHRAFVVAGRDAGESGVEPLKSIFGMGTAVDEFPDPEEAAATGVEAELGEGAVECPETAVDSSVAVPGHLIRWSSSMTQWVSLMLANAEIERDPAVPGGTVRGDDGAKRRAFRCRRNCRPCAC